MQNLTEWLGWIKSIKLNEIDLTLERVSEVLQRLQYSCRSHVITVAGTNGKGSTVKALETIYLEAGLSVGAFTSPYLLQYNEQIRINGISCSDERICEAFAEVKAHSENIHLTPFEFGTLAALCVFSKHPLDLIVLEVGLGGRLDAVNAVDADVSIVTTIDIDHVDWLGATKEAIGREKAGIFRQNCPAICGDFDPPKSLIQYANDIGAPLFCQNVQFGFKEKDTGWDWWSENKQLENLPLSQLNTQNLSTALMGVQLLQKSLPVPDNVIRSALKKVTLTGRIEIIPGDTTQIFDVSHNPHAVALLANYLLKNPISGKTYAVFSMLADKDIFGTIDVIAKHIDYWHIAPLPVPRGVLSEELKLIFQNMRITHWKLHESVSLAYESSVDAAKKNDRIVVFGSFHTVGEVIALRNNS